MTKNEIINYLKSHKDEFEKNTAFQDWLYLALIREMKIEKIVI